MYSGWTFEQYVEQYDKDKSVRFIEPMSSHEINIFEYTPSGDEFAELKYDGHRGRLEFGDKARCFSRVVSKKNKWFTENTDNVPHIRDLAFPAMQGTVLDGEFDYGNTSMGVQSVMGALPEKAIAFQEANGYIPFKAFDILYYKGINVQKMPLWKRKVYLALAVLEIWDYHGEESSWWLVYAEMYMTSEARSKFYKLITRYVEKMPTHNFNKLDVNYVIQSRVVLVNNYADLYSKFIEEDLEGIMLKTMFGIYEQKRSKSYLKVKGQSTWDCVVMGYTEPTREYTGKEIETWKYWEVGDIEMELSGQAEAIQLSEIRKTDCIPITKPQYMGWCGAIQFGVWKPFDEDEFMQEHCDDPEYLEFQYNLMHIEGKVKEIKGATYELVHVGDCKGLSEKALEEIRINGDELIGAVLEVKANGIVDINKGSLRHPRFGKWRKDKTSEMCLWDDHLRNLGGTK